MVRVVAHLCQWVGGQPYHGPTDSPSGQAAIKENGGVASRAFATLSNGTIGGVRRRGCLGYVVA